MTFSQGAAGRRGNAFSHFGWYWLNLKGIV
jgi:hypothetical protein